MSYSPQTNTGSELDYNDKTQAIKELLNQLKSDIESNEVDFVAHPDRNSSFLVIPRNKDYAYELHSPQGVISDIPTCIINMHNKTSYPYMNRYSIALGKQPYFDEVVSICTHLEAKTSGKKLTFAPGRTRDFIQKVLEAQKDGNVDLYKIMEKVRQEDDTDRKIQKHYENIPYQKFMNQLKSDLKDKKSEIHIYPNAIYINFSGDDYGYEVFNGAIQITSNHNRIHRFLKSWRAEDDASEKSEKKEFKQFFNMIMTSVNKWPKDPENNKYRIGPGDIDDKTNEEDSQHDQTEKKQPDGLIDRGINEAKKIGNKLKDKAAEIKKFFDNPGKNKSAKELFDDAMAGDKKAIENLKKEIEKKNKLFDSEYFWEKSVEKTAEPELSKDWKDIIILYNDKFGYYIDDICAMVNNKPMLFDHLIGEDAFDDKDYIENFANMGKDLNPEIGKIYETAFAQLSEEEKEKVYKTTKIQKFSEIWRKNVNVETDNDKEPPVPLPIPIVISNDSGDSSIPIIISDDRVDTPDIDGMPEPGTDKSDDIDSQSEISEDEPLTPDDRVDAPDIDGMPEPGTDKSDDIDSQSEISEDEPLTPDDRVDAPDIDNPDEKPILDDPKRESIEENNRIKQIQLDKKLKELKELEEVLRKGNRSGLTPKQLQRVEIDAEKLRNELSEHHLDDFEQTVKKELKGILNKGSISGSLTSEDLKHAEELKIQLRDGDWDRKKAANISEALKNILAMKDDPNLSKEESERAEKLRKLFGIGQFSDNERETLDKLKKTLDIDGVNIQSLTLEQIKQAGNLMEVLNNVKNFQTVEKLLNELLEMLGQNPTPEMINQLAEQRMRVTDPKTITELKKHQPGINHAKSLTIKQIMDNDSARYNIEASKNIVKKEVSKHKEELIKEAKRRLTQKMEIVKEKGTKKDDELEAEIKKEKAEKAKAAKASQLKINKLKKEKKTSQKQSIKEQEEVSKQIQMIDKQLT
ncbi:MAG: hypothetical protein FWG80_00400 [Alphaproteobacteria bacterium]|nr:hypothetical protein [Alphaproteobacteria bacterium]